MINRLQNQLQLFAHLGDQGPGVIELEPRLADFRLILFTPSEAGKGIYPSSP